MTNSPIPDDQMTCLVVALKGADLRRLDAALPPGKTRDDFILDAIRNGAPPPRRKVLHEMAERLRTLEGNEQQHWQILMRQAKDMGAIEGWAAGCKVDLNDHERRLAELRRAVTGSALWAAVALAVSVLTVVGILIGKLV